MSTKKLDAKLPSKFDKLSGDEKKQADMSERPKFLLIIAHFLLVSACSYHFLPKTDISLFSAHFFSLFASFAEN